MHPKPMTPTIPVIVLKICSPELSPDLAKLYNKCLAESCFPSCRKSSSDVSVFKNDGERSDPGKYSPISLLPIISKIFEYFINESLTKHLDIAAFPLTFSIAFVLSGPLLTS